MTIRAGQIIHDAHGFVLDRVQSGGITNFNIPEEKVYELGNYRSVTTVRDTPDLTFDVESFDVSTEVEAINNFVDPTTVVTGDEFDPNDAIPLDIISPIKSPYPEYAVNNGIVIPYLVLEQSTYRFGVGQSSTQNHSYKGDSVFYVDGAPYYEEFSGNGSNGPFVLAHTAQTYNYLGDARHVLGVCVVAADGSYTRLVFGDDYTDTSTNFTLSDGATDAPSGSTIRVVYGSDTAANYPQTVHQGVSVKPGAVRGKDIDIYIGTTAATPTFSRWAGVQTVEVTRRVNLEADKELGNEQNTDQSYDVPEVTGTVTVKPRSVTDLWDKIYQVANVNPGEVAGPNTSVGIPLEIRISDPNTGTRAKTLYVPDARFTIPTIQGRVQQKAEVTFNFSSDEGVLLVYKGNRYGT